MNGYAQAQLYTWTFDGNPPNAAPGTGNAAAPANTTLSNFTATAGLTQQNDPNVFHTHGWSSNPSPTAYVGYTIQANASNVLFLTGTNWDTANHESGPNHGPLTTSLELFGGTTSLGTSSTFNVTTTPTNHAFDFTHTITSDAVEFRIYGFGANANNQGLEQDNVALNGTVHSVNDLIALTANTQVFAENVNFALNDQLSGGFSLTKTGSGTVTLAGANSYTGGTSINAGVLQLGNTDTLLTTSSLTFNGGTLSTGATTGFDQTLNSLTLADASSLAFGTGSHTLTFSTLSDTSGVTDVLSITGWTGTFNNPGTGGVIEFTGIGDASTANTTHAGFLAKVQFSGFNLGSATFVNTGGGVQLVPVPEPATVLGLSALGLGLIGWVRRRSGTGN